MASPRVCSITACKKSVRALCMCCEQYVCLNHLQEHSDSINAQLIPLSDEINTLFDKFNRQCSGKSNFHTELDNWCQQAHLLIDRFCQQKKQEYEEIQSKKLNEQSLELNRIRTEIHRLTEEQDATKEHIALFNHSIQLLEQQINQCLICEMKFFPLVIPDDLISIHNEKTNAEEIFRPPTINIKDAYYSIAANDNHLLIVQDSKLCLYNRQLYLIKQIPWLYDNLYDLIWSTTLDRFIIIASKRIFILNEASMTIESCLTDDLNTDCYCGTCFKNTLFLVTKDKRSPISTYNLQPKIKLLEKQFTPLCKENSCILDISSNDTSIAITVGSESSGNRYFHVCRPTNLQLLFSFVFTCQLTYSRIRCCSLSNNQWMIVNPEKSELLQISADGKLIKTEQYKSSIRAVTELDNNLIAILTKESLDLYKKAHEEVQLSK